MGKKPRVRLIHWKPEEIPERARRLRRAGCTVIARPVEGGADLRREWHDVPDAFVIDLGRLPSQGRDLAVFLRKHRGTRLVPIVFVDGAPEKVRRTRALFPDATYTTWRSIGPALRRALAHPPAEPVVHGSAMAGYSGTPLPRKLGIKEGSVVVLIGAPDDFEETLGALPPRVILRRQDRGGRDLTVWFVRSATRLTGRVSRLAAKVGNGGLWIAWPKKASGVATDVTEALVRRTGLGAGLVDYKICAIDRTWSGLKFSRRKR